MTDHVITAQTGHYFFSPFGFISYSEDFYEACCSHVTPRPFSPAKYYMACRSIELSLKAFLLLKGVTRHQLKKKPLQHDLHEILKRCKELGISSLVSMCSSQELHIEALNKWYARKGFEYFELENLGGTPLPSITEVQELANLLIEGLKEPCKNAANEP
jgi:hypothetical protein